MAEGWQTLTDKALDNPFGYQSVNAIYQQMRALAAPRPHFVGGSRTLPLRGATGALTLDLEGFLNFEIDSSKHAGFTVRVRFEVRTTAAGTTVTPRVYNVTDKANATYSGAVACSATDTDYEGTNQVQNITITPASGVKRYRAQVDVSNGNADVYAFAQLEFVTP